MSKHIEHRIFHKIKNMNLPNIIRYTIAGLLIISGFFISFILVIAGLCLLVKAKDIKKIIKIRKGIDFLIRNCLHSHKFRKLKSRNIFCQKIKDFKKVFRKG